MAYRLYIVMRNDMASMNPGKGMAQAAHAANDMVHTIENEGADDEKEALKEWQAEGGTFGTTIVFGAGIDKINELDIILPFSGGVVRDTSYPIKDGEVTHHIDIVTCAWFFADEADWKSNPLAQTLKLHR